MIALVTRTTISDIGETHTSTTTAGDWKSLSEDFEDRANHGGTYTQIAPNAFEYSTTGNTLVRYELLMFLTDDEAKQFPA